MFQADTDLTVDLLRSVVSRNGAIALATSENVKTLVDKERGLVSKEARSNRIRDAFIDYALACAEPAVQGNDSDGYRVVLWPNATYKTSVFVVKEGGNYKVLGTTTFKAYIGGVGLEVLDRIAANSPHALGLGS